MAYLRTRYRTFNVDGSVATTELVTLVYPDAQSCSQAEAPFAGLSTVQAVAKRATCATTTPAPAVGKHWEARNCSGNPDPDPDPEPGGGGTDGDEPAVNTDLSGEENIIYYDAN